MRTDWREHLRKTCVRLAAATVFCIAAYGQVSKSLTFDAATVKPAPPPKPDAGGRIFLPPPTGGPGSSDPGRVRYPFITLKNLLTIAYRVKSFQVSGPAWLDSERYEVSATMPPDTTPDQFQAMVQNLLAERFQMTVHRESRELPMYALVVVKGGIRMKEAAPPVEAADPTAPPVGLPPAGQAKIGPDGFPMLPAPPGRPNNSMIMMNGRAKMFGTMQTMDDFASRLTQQLNRPVVNETGLTAKYDFILRYTPDGMAVGPMIAPPPGAGVGGPTLPEVDSLPSLPNALQSDLGLRLEPKKGTVEMVVVDRAEKVPTEN